MEAGRNLSPATFRYGSVDGFGEIPVAFSRFKLKQLTGLSKWEIDDTSEKITKTKPLFTEQKSKCMAP